MKRVPAAHSVLFLALATGGAALDLWTKALAFGRLGVPGKYVIWPGVFSFTTSFNRGGLAILYWLFWHGAAGDRVLTTSLGLIMGGTVGNCYDRVLFGQVRDFLYFELINWPIFNLADSLLVCGATLLVIQAVFAGPVEAPTASSAAGGENASAPPPDLEPQASPLNSSSSA